MQTIPILQVFTHQYCTCTIGQTLTILGNLDPYLQPSGKLTAYKKEDPPLTRVKPIPFPIIAHTTHLCYISHTSKSHCIANMLILGFFFLLWPGEYTHTSNPEAALFWLTDTHILINDCCLNHLLCSKEELLAITYIALEFTTHKNGVQGELLGLGRSGHPTWCPVKALLNQIRHLHTFKASPTTPLYSYFDMIWHRIDTQTLAPYLCNSVTVLGHNCGIQPHKISICSSGAMGRIVVRTGK